MRHVSLFAFALLWAAFASDGGHAQLATTSREPGVSCRASAKLMARLELLFGTSRRQATPIGDEEWASFLDAEVTPRFPNGFTVLNGFGQWRSVDGRLAKERAILLVIWYEPTSLVDADIEAIRSAYKQRFDQESVLFQRLPFEVAI